LDKWWLSYFGFLKFATKGPFAGVFQAMAGNPLVDWLFMLGLLGIGLGLMLGIFMKISTFFGGINACFDVFGWIFATTA
jgi:hypothetical protein